MYIANRRENIKFNSCSPLQLHFGLIGLEPAIQHVSYRQTLAASFKKRNTTI